MAAATDMMSPYVAMNNDPVLNVDPLGLQAGTMDVQKDMGAYMDPMGGLLGRLSEGYLKGLGASGRVDNIDWMQGAQERVNDLFWGLVYTALQSISGQVDIFKNGGGEWEVNFNASFGRKDKDVSREIGSLKLHESGLFAYSMSKKTDGDNGIKFSFLYIGNLSKYSKSDFIQTVTTNVPDEKYGKPNTPYLDGQWSENPPFYFSKNGSDRYFSDINSNNYNGKFFNDNPSRVPEDGFHYWLGQLSLVGLVNGKYENIITINYGYYYGIVGNFFSGFRIDLIPYYPKITSPTSTKEYFNYKK